MTDLDCGYDINKEQCRSCLRRQNQIKEIVMKNTLIEIKDLCVNAEDKEILKYTKLQKYY